MARGFESKSVAGQQEAAEGGLQEPRAPDGAEPAIKARRKRLELARVDVLGQLERAQADAHKQMLKRALAALDAELASLDGQ
jgi:hypothetical protein